MAIESEAAEQSVGIALQAAKTGGELAMGTAKLGAVGVAKLLAVIYHKAKEGKILSPGEKKLQELAKDGENLHLFTIPEDNLDLAHTGLKEYGISYAVIEQEHGGDGTIDLVVRERDAVRAARALERSRALEEPADAFLRKPKREEPEDDLPDRISELYIEEKSTFDRMTEQFGGEAFAGKEKVFCDAENADCYVKVKTEAEKREERTVYSTTFTPFRDGEQLGCSEYRHGMFIRRTDAEGKNTSEEGQKHWEHVKQELREKCGIGTDVLVFASEEKYRAYLEERKKELAARNTEDFAKHFVEDVTRNPASERTGSADPFGKNSPLRKRGRRSAGNRKPSVRKKLAELRSRASVSKTPEPVKTKIRRRKGRNR